jgi:hypothetical protein
VWVMALQKSSDSLGFDMIWLGCVGAVGPFWFLHRTCARLCVGSVVFSLAACYLGLVSAAWPLRRYRNASRPKMTLAIFQLLVPESSTANPFQLFNHEKSNPFCLVSHLRPSGAKAAPHPLRAAASFADQLAADEPEAHVPRRPRRDRTRWWDELWWV